MQHMQATAGKLVKGQQQTTRSHPYQTLLQLYLSRFLPRGGDSRSGIDRPHVNIPQIYLVGSAEQI